MDKNPTRSVNQITINTRGKNSRSPELCQRYKMGRCSKGQNCKYAHVEGKPCRDYRMGRCFKGENCKFVHVEGHQSNMADIRDDDYYYGKNLLGLHGGPAGGEIERYDQTGVQHGANSTFKSQFATAPPHGPYGGTSNVTTCDQVDSSYRTQSAIVDPSAQNRMFLHAGPAPRFGKKSNWKTKICPKWQNGFCPHGSICTFAHGDHELQGQSGSQNTRTESVAAPPHVPPAKVSASDQVNRISRTESATAPPRRPPSGTPNVSATADPRGAYHGTANVSSRDHKNVKHPFDWDRKTVGIYADWLEIKGKDDETT